MYTTLLTAEAAAKLGGSSAPLRTGTVVYVALPLIAIFVTLCCIGSGRIPKQDCGVYIISVISTGVCLWSVWILTWLHQWHPLLIPTNAGH